MPVFKKPTISCREGASMTAKYKRLKRTYHHTAKAQIHQKLASPPHQVTQLSEPLPINQKKPASPLFGGTPLDYLTTHPTKKKGYLAIKGINKPLMNIRHRKNHQHSHLSISERLTVTSITARGEATFGHVIINNAKHVALFDSGAAKSFMTKRFANHLQCQVVPPERPEHFMTANREPLSITGKCLLDLKIGEKELNGEFFVSQPLAHDIIIGSDIMKENCIDIVFSTGTIKIGKTSTPLIDNGIKSNKVCQISSPRASELVNLSERLTVDETDLIKRLIDRYSDVFSKDETDIGRCEITHHIELTSNDPVRARSYRLPYSQRQLVEQEIDKLLRMGVIRRSKSDFTSPAILVKKKDGTPRFVVDFRRLNDKTVKDRYPMPYIEEQLEKLRDKKYFSTLDLTSGYWQFGIDEKSRKYTAFSTHIGLFEWNRMPMGLCNSGATFQRAMDKMLIDEPHTRAYVDDIMIACNSFNEHIECLEKTFMRLREYGLKVKPKKCMFGDSETMFLGFIVSGDGMKVCESRSDCIRRYPRPQNTKQVRQFLGLASYYRKFIRNFSSLAAPLNELLTKGTKFNWKESCESAFKSLVNHLINPPVLIFPDLKRKFRLITDASQEGLGAVLAQVDDDGEERAIAFASRSLTTAERNYHTTEQELLAVVWALGKFRPYLYGVDSFDLFTDHKALCYLNSLSDKSQRVTRWKLLMQEYNYVFHHRAGVDNANADALSRIECYDSEAESPINISPILACGIINDELTFSDEEMRRLQDDDEHISNVKQEISDNKTTDGYAIIGGLLFHEDKPEIEPSYAEHQKRLVLPHALIDDVLIMCHEGFSGHLGIDKTLAKVSDKFFWDSMTRDVKAFCESCEICCARKNTIVQRAPLGSITHPKKPFDTIGMDFLGPLPETTNGSKYVLVITDYATRWVEAFATKDMKATTVARILINEIICRHSAPIEILSDQGRNFLSEIITEVCKYFSINKIQTTAYHPQTNGLTERFNATLCQMLSAYINEAQTNWDLYLPVVLFAYRTSKQKTTESTPFNLLYGREARLPTALDRWSPNYYIINSIDEEWKNAKKRIEAQAEKSAKTLSNKYKALNYPEGTQVRLHQPATKTGLKYKLRGDRWQGPYEVLEESQYNVKLKPGKKEIWVHKNRVKPQKSRYGRQYKEPSRMGAATTEEYHRGLRNTFR